MNNLILDFQGEFQYLKYEYAPRLRMLIKNIHIVMNSYNKHFFSQCQKFGDVRAIEQEAVQTGVFPEDVRQAMVKADAFKPVAETILLRKIANQISSFAFFNFTYKRGGVNPDLGLALLYAVVFPFVYRIGKNYAYAMNPEFVDFYSAKPFWGTDALTVPPMRITRKRTNNGKNGVFPKIYTGLEALLGTYPYLKGKGLGTDNPFQTREERLYELYQFYIENKKDIFFFSKKDFYTLSEECVIARLWNFLSRPFDASGKPFGSTPKACDYFSHEKFLTTQGTFQERLDKYRIPNTEILQVPAFSEEEIKEGLKILETVKKVNIQLYDLSKEVNRKLYTWGDPRAYKDLADKINYREKLHPTNHIGIAPF